MWYGFLIVAVILLDQVTKICVAALSGVAAPCGEVGVAASQSQKIGSVVKGFIEIEYAENYNGMMGIFARFGNINIAFIVVTVIILIGICIYLHFAKNRGKWINVTLSLVIAGAIGNLIDRLITQYVRDFIHVYLFGDIFPFIFNIADVSLVIGAIMLIIYVLFMGDEAVFRSKASKEKRKAARQAKKAAEGETGEGQS